MSGMNRTKVEQNLIKITHYLEDLQKKGLCELEQNMLDQALIHLDNFWFAFKHNCDNANCTGCNDALGQFRKGGI